MFISQNILNIKIIYVESIKDNKYFKINSKKKEITDY